MWKHLFIELTPKQLKVLLGFFLVMATRPSGRNTRAPRAARNHQSIPKRHPQMAQFPAKPKAAVPTPSRGCGRRPYVVPCPMTSQAHKLCGAVRPYSPGGTCRCSPVNVTALPAGVGGLHIVRLPDGCSPPSTPQGRRRGPWPTAGDCAICGWRFGTLGCFAPCAARVFRPLRLATGALPLDPAIF